MLRVESHHTHSIDFDTQMQIPVESVNVEEEEGQKQINRY